MSLALLVLHQDPVAELAHYRLVSLPLPVVDNHQTGVTGQQLVGQHRPSNLQPGPAIIEDEMIFPAEAGGKVEVVMELLL